MNRKENMMAILHHQPHEHVGNTFTDMTTLGKFDAYEIGGMTGGVDGFGVTWVPTESTAGMLTPLVGAEVLGDICAWREDIRFPDVSQITWDDPNGGFMPHDPTSKVLAYDLGAGPFMRLIHLMGFENGLMALHEEPGECAALMEALVDFKLACLGEIKKRMDVEAVFYVEDFASQRGLMMSPEAYRAVIKPVHKRFNDGIKALGVIPIIHICGLCEDVIGDVVEEGADAWEVCQPVNDLVALQEKYADNLAFLGGFDLMRSVGSEGEYDEEELRAYVRETIDKYAPGGNYATFGALVSTEFDTFISSMMTIGDETIKYGTDYYK